MKDVYAAAERLMGMSNETWRRHASPWSVYTRMLTLPFLALAIWSRVWIGVWAWAAVAVVIAWVLLNPRAFPPPASLDNWVSRGVLGERVFLRRRNEVAGHHRVWATILTTASALGAVVLGLGLWWLDLAWTVFGTILTMGSKIWFVDRMVWLYGEWLRDTGRELGDV
ncbi:MAG: DUF6653 family protein [Albidovulum sp.]|uniref:DUF6653 family protein n=1 Tax=Albidovulum sp. TaxID=1872424 RepID=UPI003CB9BA29